MLFGWLLAQPRWAQQQQIAGGSQRASSVHQKGPSSVEQPAGRRTVFSLLENISTKNKSVVTALTAVKMAQQSL